MTNGVKIGIGVGLIVGVAILAVRYNVRKQGWSKSKLLSNVFSVPLVDKKYMDLQEQTENQLTKDKIEFR